MGGELFLKIHISAYRLVYLSDIITEVSLRTSLWLK